MPSEKTNHPQTENIQTPANIQAWDLSGVIAIRDIANKNNISANINWQQASNHHYSIRLFGPLGAGALKLTGQPGQVKLTSSDGKTYTAATPELLLAEQAHWNLPLSHLYYWIRGIPVPSLPAKTHFDASHHLSELQQDGWRIQFLRYTSTQHIDVPSKIFLFNSSLNVKIIINEWKF